MMEEQTLTLNGLEIKYKFKEKKYDCEHLIIIFSGFAPYKEFTYDFENSLAVSRANVLWIKDDFKEHACYYLCQNMDFYIEEIIYQFIEQKIKELNLNQKNVTLLGLSKGGSAALYYGLKYNFSNIVCAVPQIKIASYVLGKTKVTAKKASVVAKHMLGEYPQTHDIVQLDNLIPRIIKEDQQLDKNIYLLTGKADPQYYTEIEPVLPLLRKYQNFNLIVSESIYAKNHEHIIRHNSPLLIHLVGLLSDNLSVQLNHKKFENNQYNIKDKSAKPIVTVETLSLKEECLFIEGVALLRGLEAANWEDVKYTLHLKNAQRNYSFYLNKGNRPYLTQKYFNGDQVIYDKAYYKTNNGIYLINIVEPGIYHFNLEVCCQGITKNVKLCTSQPLRLTTTSCGHVYQISSKSNGITLNVKAISNWSLSQQLDIFQKQFKKSGKIWLYKDNILAMHFENEISTLIIDVVEGNETIEIRYFDKFRIFTQEIQEIINNLSGSTQLKNQKVIVKVQRKSISNIYSYLNDNIGEFYRQFTQKLNDYSYHEKFTLGNKALTSKIIAKRSKGEKISVGLLVNDRTKWNYESLYYNLKQSREFSVRILLARLPSFDNQDYELNKEFFRQIDNNILYISEMDQKGRINLIADQFDIMFYQQPWGMRYWVKSLHTKVLGCFTHYGYLIFEDKLDYCIDDFHPFIWRFFAQNELHKLNHIKFTPAVSEKIRVSGYAKMDTYQVPVEPSLNSIWPINVESAHSRIIYAPHHSVGPSLLKIGTFDWNHQKIQDLMLKHLDTAWVYKPHGRLRYMVTEHNIMTEEQYRNYLGRWATNNSIIYDNGNYFDIFKTSDVLITDSSSFLAEYFPTGKPIIWLVSARSKMKFNDFGKRLTDGFYKVHNLEELESVFNQVVIQKYDPLLSIRQKIIQECFDFKASSAEKIHEFLLEEFPKPIILPPAKPLHRTNTGSNLVKLFKRAKKYLSK